MTPLLVDSIKRNEILDNCTTEEERQKTAEIIRPILRGRDVCRYGYEWGDLWLINTHNGIKGKLEGYILRIIRASNNILIITGIK